MHLQRKTQETPEAALCHALRAVLRRHTRKPFQLLKQFLLFSEEESIEVSRSHARFQLEMVEENIRSACTRIRQRLLVDAFITVKNLFLRGLRVEQAYYSHHNLTLLSHAVTAFQQFSLKWEGFGRLYEHSRASRLLRLNLSKIDALSNDYTSRELDDFRPFLTSGERGEGKEEEETPRSLRKSCTALQLKQVEETEEVQSRVLATQRRERVREEGGSTARASRLQGEEVQQIYLIRDYGFKRTPPTNYVKVPVLSDNLKIVEISTRRRGGGGERAVRAEWEVQRQVCASCKYCVREGGRAIPPLPQ